MNWKNAIGKQEKTAKKLGCAELAQEVGYRHGHTMTVATTQSGGHRLYVAIGGRWMDASLRDLENA